MGLCSKFWRFGVKTQLQHDLQMALHFLGPSKSLLQASISGGPPSSPPKTGSHHFYFILLFFFSYSPSISSAPLAASNTTAIGLPPPPQVPSQGLLSDLRARWAEHGRGSAGVHTIPTLLGALHPTIEFLFTYQPRRSRATGVDGSVELAPVRPGSSGAGSSATARLAVAAHAPEPPWCGGARADLALARQRRAGVLRPRPRARQRETRSK
jgi:hypothetical protein